ncbi:TetR/AcrR family transcriptional regulator [Lentzea nigeriaca]|uniref:TetR/AcrR family transcriptional regulator n=1 Tax=Lentzea nigeriaca TaxID=1128665 RepID=UPI00195DAD81|nr:TetR/AcrR family transcriptional regulator [Lentzea nigeriaca]MBM7858919.1 AcrR family transcriptional regulator [Lentzea nigeriaca]
MTAERTADRIASAARAILLAEGAAAVSMRRVAEAAGITPMAIYTHFPNRDALLREVAEATFAELATSWGRRGEQGGWEERLFGQLQDFLDFALGQPHLYAFLLTEQRAQARRFPEDFRDGGSPIFTPAAQALEQGMREGALRRDDPLEMALTLTAQTQGLVQLYLGGRIGLSEQEFRALCERTGRRVLDGLRA